MFTYRNVISLGMVVVALAATACGDTPEAPRLSGGPVLSSVSGIPSTEAAMRERLRETTRLVALALGNPALRAQLKSSLDASPYREHKLHFSEFLRGSGRGLLAGMAAGRKRATEAEVLSGIDSLIDAELYLPVRSHRGRWKGGKDLIVASALRDHEIPVAFDLDGNPVTLTSATIPPETPTLALVPVETDFSRGIRADDMAMLECEGTCDPGDGGMGGSTIGGGTGGSSEGAGSGASLSVSAAVQSVGGVAMIFSAIPDDDYEGFLMGNPEFEVHAIGVGSAGTAKDWQCAGEHAATAVNQPGIKSSAYVYDQNDATWTGSVVLLSKDQTNAAQAGGAPVIYWVWEDDNTECKIVEDSAVVSTLMRGVPTGLSHGLNAIKALFSPDSAHQGLLRAEQFIKEIREVLGAFQNDDVVGFLVDKSEVNTDWSDATHAIVLKKPDGTLAVRGRARLVAITP